MAKVKFGHRMIRAFLYGMGLAVFSTIGMAVAGGILYNLGFDMIPKMVYPATGFLFGFAIPLAIEVSKEMEEG